jgi:ribosome-binding factor A
MSEIIMQGKRQKQVAKLIQKELSDIFFRSPSLIQNKFVTITELDLSGDLGVATAYLSFLMVEDEASLINTIEENKHHIRRELASRLRHQFRRVPELIFVVDRIQEEANRIDSLLSKLDIPPEAETEDEDDF